MRKFAIYVTIVMCLWAFSAVNSDAAMTGNISGVVIDSTSQPVPGVQVTVSGTGLPGARTDYTREDGRYRIVLLPPGEYVVRAELAGFKTVEKSGITVNINNTSRVDVTMEVSTFEEVVVVTAEQPVLDTKTTSVGINIEREFTERLPGSDSFQSAFAMGGATVGGSNPNVHGSSSTENSYLVDGVDTTDPVTGTFSANLNADAIEEVEVQTGGFSAEYGKALGGIVNAVTKTGGNKFEGIVRFKYETDTFNASADEGKPNIDVNDHFEPTISLGGPIVKDKAWFFLSYRRSVYDNSEDVRLSRDFDTNEYTFTSIDTDDIWQYWVGKVTWSITPSHNVEVSYSSDPAVLENSGGVSYRPEAQQKWEQGGDRYGINWTYILSSNLYFDTKYSQFASYIYQGPQSDSGLPSIYDRKARIYYQNFDQYDDNDRSQWTIASTATYIKENWKGIHEFKVGFDYQNVEEERYVNYTTGTYYEIDYYGTSEELPFRKYIYIDPKAEANKGKILSFFIQDAWEAVPGLTFNIGLRYDQSSYENKLGEEVHSFDGVIAPRLGVAWDINNDGKSKIYANFGRFYSMIDLQLVGVEGGPSTISQEWRYDRDGSHADEVDDEGYYLFAESGGESSDDFIDPDLSPEYKDEFILGYEQEIMANWSAGARLIYHEMKNIIEDVGFYYDENGNPVLATDVDINDQAAVDEWYDRWTRNYTATNVDDAYRDYFAIELTSSARTEKFSAEISYTYSDVEGIKTNTQPTGTGVTHFSVYYDTPYLSNDVDGPLDWDVPHYIKINAYYNLPWGFVVGLKSWYKSGYPYNLLGDQGAGPDGVYGTDDDIDNTDPAYGPGVTVPRGKNPERLPGVFMVDMSLQKDFDFGKWGVLTGIVDISNVLDNQVVLAREENEGETWGTDLGWASPRSVLFQLKYAF